MTSSPRYECSRLVLVHYFNQFFNIVLWHFSGCIKPDDFNWTILRSNLFHLRQAFFNEIIIKGCRLTTRINLWPAATTWKSPVLVMGIIKSKPQPFFPTSCRQFFHWIFAPGSCINNIKITCLGLIHREAVMMFRGYDYVFHPCIPS